MTTTSPTQRMTMIRALEDYSEELVKIADKTISREMMVKLLKYHGYDEDKDDYYIKYQDNRLYRKHLENKKSKRPGKPEPVMTITQLNNFKSVALETESLAVVVNWIHYQMGRSKTSKAWEGTGFGKLVLEDILQIRTWAEKVAEDFDLPRRSVEIAMIRRYTGYLVRWFVARGGQE